MPTTPRYLATRNRSWRCIRSSSRYNHRTSLAQPATPPLAFVFDIDGVLLRGAQVIPAAKRALAILEGDNPMHNKIPYILMTNGGGIAEEERCHGLTQQLGFTITPNQYIQAHTILKTKAHQYTDSPVLVLGGKLDSVRHVAESYGFKNAYTTLDVHAWDPTIWPFHDLSPGERLSAKPVDFSKTPISAIFVFHDPRNWSLDIQVICDVIQSRGLLGGPYVPPDQTTGPPVELVFCNPDLLWRSDFSRPRLGQGAFKEAFQAVYKALTGSTYPYVQYGKPTAAAYRYAAQVLSDCLPQESGQNRNLPNVYMVGDNPESDIAGANAANWASVLVHTGVFDPAQGPPAHEPTRQARDVEEAVRWAIEREMKRCYTSAD